MIYNGFGGILSLTQPYSSQPGSQHMSTCQLHVKSRTLLTQCLMPVPWGSLTTLTVKKSPTITYANNLLANNIVKLTEQKAKLSLAEGIREVLQP